MIERTAATDVLPSKRILLAEDDECARAVMAAVLRSLGAEVIEAVDGGRMLVAVAAHYKEGKSPDDLDLVVTDAQMPVMGGLDVFKGLRTAGWRTPVVVVTGLDTDEVRETVRRFGAVLLPKPLDLDLFEATVRDLLTQPSSRKQPISRKGP
jgi:two-component system chemotaxis response regulator CheY